MDRLIEGREQLLRFYAKYSRLVDKGLQFVLALMTFIFISSNIGFMRSLSSPLAVIGLAVVCTCLPISATVLVAVMVTVLQFYALSPGVAAVAAVIFMIMFVMYFRFTPNQGILLLLTPIAFALKMPLAIPIIYGLIGSPICIVPIAFGTIGSYMITYVKAFDTPVKSAGNAQMITQMVTFIQQLFKNKDMGITIISFVVCLLVVYIIRRLAVENAWKIAIVSGTLSGVLCLVVGKIMAHSEVKYMEVLVGAVFAILIAFVVEFFVFSVDYSRTEKLQFEDDEYVYFVKAVPKMNVPVQEKTVKKINERQETTKVKLDDYVISRADEMMLEKALQEELEIQELLEEELKN